MFAKISAIAVLAASGIGSLAQAQTSPASMPPIPAIPALPPPPGMSANAVPATPLSPGLQEPAKEEEGKKEEAKAPPAPPPIPGSADMIGASPAPATAAAPADTTTAEAPAEAAPPQASAGALAVPPLPAPSPVATAQADILPLPEPAKETKKAEKAAGEPEPPPTSLAARLNASPTGIVLPPAPKLPKVHMHSAGRQKTWLTALKPVVTPRDIKFNYKRQLLPGTIYRPYYDADNQHLPTAITGEDYDRWLLESVAANDLQGTRALLDAGRSPNLINAQGDTVLTVALHHGALDVARLLIARGGNPYLRGPSGRSAYDTAAVTGQLMIMPQPVAMR